MNLKYWNVSTEKKTKEEGKKSFYRKAMEVIL